MLRFTRRCAICNDAEMELMNLILLSISNDIYNSVDACTSAKDMWKRVEPSYEAHTGSSSRNTSSYYVTHPTSVVDYEDEYQQDDVHTNSEDPLTSAMLGGYYRGIYALNETRTVQRILKTCVQEGNTSIVQCYNCSGKDIMLGYCPKPRVQDSNISGTNVGWQNRMKAL
ncbi:hypothetical protein Tco_0807983 [Tanacetum coccineum]